MVFHFLRSKKRRPFIIILLDRLSEHFRGRNALGFARRRTSKLVGRAATQPNTNSKSSNPLGLLHEDLLSGPSFLAPCAQKKLAATLCPCNILLAACQFVLIAARRFLQFVTYFVGRAAHAPSRRCCVRFVELRWCRSWPLVAGLGGWD